MYIVYRLKKEGENIIGAPKIQKYGAFSSIAPCKVIALNLLCFIFGIGVLFCFAFSIDIALEQHIVLSQ